MLAAALEHDVDSGEGIHDVGSGEEIHDAGSGEEISLFECRCQQPALRGEEIHGGGN